MKTMEDIKTKVRAYKEMQQLTIVFIDELANHAMDINKDTYEDLIELKDMIYADEILLQDAITKSVAIFESMDLVK